MYDLTVRTSFGLEALVKRQLKELNITEIKVSDGMLELKGDDYTLSNLNINLRHADRIYIRLNSFKALSFEELFENIYKMDWSDYLSKDANFILNARSYKSKLFSLRDIQSISEKAVIKSLQRKYHIAHFTKSKERVSIEISIIKDIVTVSIDTSGEGLHKRGYRVDTVKAPLRENLAAALVDLSFYNKDRFLYDPFVGSGTILIEAARIQRNIAPGLDRDFDFNHFIFFDREEFKRARKDNLQKIDFDSKLHLLGSDINPKAIEICKANAQNAGVYDDISFITRDFKNVAMKDDYGIIITNPPYGKRLSNANLKEIYNNFNEKFKKHKSTSFYILTADEKFDKFFSKKVDRKRNLYNGNMKVTYYQYYGKKPERSFKKD